MNEMYWVTRCDGLLTAMIIPMVICIIVAGVSFVISCDSYFDDDERKVARKYSIICGSVGLFLLIAQAFIPTTKQALIIYGVGGTIDYIKSNDTAKQLPDKAIIALDKYLESINDETENKKE